MDLHQSSLPPTTVLKHHKNIAISLHNLDISPAQRLSGVVDIAFSPDGNFFAVAYSKVVAAWEVHRPPSGSLPDEQWKYKIRFNLSEVEEPSVTCMTWTSSGYLIIGMSSGDVGLLSLKSSDMIVRGCQIAANPIRFVAVDREFRFLAAVAGSDQVSLWQCDGFRIVNHIRILPRPDHERTATSPLPEVKVTSVAWSAPSSGTLVVSYLNHGIVSWNAVVREPYILSRIESPEIVAGCLAPNGVFFATPNEIGTFDIYNLATKRKIVLRDPDPDTAGRSEFPQVCRRAGRFMFGGAWFIGAGVGKAHLWNVVRNVRAQKIHLSNGFSQLPISHISVSGVASESGGLENLRIAVCGQGTMQAIDIWRGVIEGKPELLLADSSNFEFGRPSRLLRPRYNGYYISLGILAILVSLAEALLSRIK